MNMYAYCGNNWLNCIDPFGLEEYPVTGYLVSQHPCHQGTMIYEILGQWNFTGLWRDSGLRYDPDLFIHIKLTGPGIDSSLPAYRVANDWGNGLPVTTYIQSVWTDMRLIDYFEEDNSNWKWTDIRISVPPGTRVSRLPREPLNVPIDRPGEDIFIIPDAITNSGSAAGQMALETITAREQMRRNTVREAEEYLEGLDIPISEVRPVLGTDYENRKRELNEVEQQIQRERELQRLRPPERIIDPERSIINNGR